MGLDVVLSFGRGLEPVLVDLHPVLDQVVREVVDGQTTGPLGLGLRVGGLLVAEKDLFLDSETLARVDVVPFAQAEVDSCQDLDGGYEGARSGARGVEQMSYLRILKQPEGLLNRFFAQGLREQLLVFLDAPLRVEGELPCGLQGLLIETHSVRIKREGCRQPARGLQAIPENRVRELDIETVPRRIQAAGLGGFIRDDRPPDGIVQEDLQGSESPERLFGLGKLDNWLRPGLSGLLGLLAGLWLGVFLVVLPSGFSRRFSFGRLRRLLLLDCLRLIRPIPGLVALLGTPQILGRLRFLPSLCGLLDIADVGFLRVADLGFPFGLFDLPIRSDRLPDAFASLLSIGSGGGGLVV